DVLCDLQLVTGLGISISGWAQFHSIGYYHQQLANFYLSWTVNSFLSSRVPYLEFDTLGIVDDGMGSILRRTILLSIYLSSLVFQVKGLSRDRNNWD
ncbi:hypothetical protein F5148DRAFT_953277, partial [Russula earlei]